MIEISLERSQHGGRYEAHITGHDEAGELTYTNAGPGRISADHTGVPDALRGQGIAQALVERLVQDAREQGFRIVPRCPFVRAQLRRHPEWVDLFDA